MILIIAKELWNDRCKCRLDAEFRLSFPFCVLRQYLLAQHVHVKYIFIKLWILISKSEEIRIQEVCDAKCPTSRLHAD